MSKPTIAEKDLPAELTPDQAVEAAYSTDLAEVASKVRRGLPCLIECDKEVTPFAFMNLRARLRQNEMRLVYLDGRPREGEGAGPVPMGLLGTMIAQLREAVRGNVERRVIVLPHLDLLVTSSGGLTGEAREAIALLYENPDLVWIGFKDPSFPLPSVITNLFPHRVSFLGIPRDRLRHLVTQRDARKFGREFNPWALYKYVSGLNAVKLRRLLSTMEGEDYPADPKTAYRQLRQATLTGTLEIPDVRLQEDIGGYTKVKKRLTKEIIDILARRDASGNEEEAARLEELLPKGMIFWGPPGTGKTYFAKAMAASLGAAITIVSGPELKSKWVGESEENLRQIFLRARQSAPSIIVFDELDSFASARGTYTGSGVEHSMVNQLLTEMDGFHKEELVFVIGTTNFVEALDPALLRPGRFEFHLHIPYPDPDDRREIIKIYNAKMKLQLTDEAVEFAVKKSGDYVDGASPGTRYSGDHIQAMCRSIARVRLRENLSGPTSPGDIEKVLAEYLELPKLTPSEERVVATHEAGHAITALFCDHSPPIEKITIRGDIAGALGYVRYQDRAHRFVVTQNELLDDLVMLLGGREAEDIVLKDLSIGSSDDLRRATGIAKALVEEFGMGGDETGVVRYNEDTRAGTARDRGLSEDQKQQLDKQVRVILRHARERARKILTDNHALLVHLRDMLLDKKVIDSKTLAEMFPGRNDGKTARPLPEASPAAKPDAVP